jgi:hypothetical protein
MSPQQVQQAFVLRALHLAGQRCLDGDVLVAHLQLAFRDQRITRADALAVIKSCEDSDWINGTSDPLLGVQWGLSPQGRIQLANLL